MSEEKPKLSERAACRQSAQRSWSPVRAMIEAQASGNHFGSDCQAYALPHA